MNLLLAILLIIWSNLLQFILGLWFSYLDHERKIKMTFEHFPNETEQSIEQKAFGSYLVMFSNGVESLEICSIETATIFGLAIKQNKITSGKMIVVNDSEMKSTVCIFHT